MLSRGEMVQYRRLVRRTAAQTDRAYGLTIGGVSIRLTSTDDGPAIRPGSTAARFAAEDGHPDIRLSVRWGNLEAPPVGAPVFDTVFPWKLYRADHGCEFHFFSATLGETPYAAPSGPRLTTPPAK